MKSFKKFCIVAENIIAMNEIWMQITCFGVSFYFSTFGREMNDKGELLDIIYNRDDIKDNSKDNTVLNTLIAQGKVSV